MGIFRRRIKFPPPPVPEPHPPIPEHLYAAWEAFGDQDEIAREGTIVGLSAWETTLPAAQQAYLREEAVGMLLATYGVEVSKEWERTTGCRDTMAGGVAALIAIFKKCASDVSRRPFKDAVGVVPIESHFRTIRDVRTLLVDEILKKHSTSGGTTVRHARP